MEYAAKLWNKYEMLHERYRKQYDRSYNIIEMLTKMQYAAKDYAKTINNIYSKNLPLCECDTSTQGKGLECLRFDFSIQADEFNEMGDCMKTKVIDPCKGILDATYAKEKEKYNELKKAITSYTNSVYYLEKAQNKFKISAEAAERSTVFAKKLKYSLANDIEKEKSNQKAKSNLLEAQENEKYYLTLLDSANKARIEAIEKQKAMLKEYQNFDLEIGNNVKSMICFYIATVKKMVSSILLDLESLSEKFKNIDINADMNEFVQKNTSDAMPNKEILFVPYKPNINPDAAHEITELPFEVIYDLKTYLKDVLPSYDLQLEEKKSQIRKLSLKVFTSNKDFVFSPEEKNQLLDFIKDNQSRLIFLYTLNKQRTTGKFARSSRLMQDLKDIVNQILEISEPEKDYESAKNCIILSQTFYIEDKEKKKHYLFESIINNKWLTSTEFWYGVIEKMIQIEFEKNESSNKEINAHETEEEKRRRISNIAFSQVLPYTNNMLDFKIDKSIILEVINSFVEKYKIEKEMADAIINNVKDRNY